MRILVMNGPNLNLLGQRQTDVYGKQTLSDLEGKLRRQARNLGVEVDFYQSNNEGSLIDALHRAHNRNQGVILNPGGYAHTSVALHDAIAGIDLPVIEVHISNIHARESFRHTSVTAAACAGMISGFGFASYEIALNAIVALVKGGEVKPVRTVEPAAEGDHERDRDQQDDEDGGNKRRRRGRRGGRGRRRREEGDDEDKSRDTGREDAGETEEEEEEVDLEQRYGSMEGVTVHRGLDVVDEDDDRDTHVKAGGSLISFGDAAEDEEDEPTAVKPAGDDDYEPVISSEPVLVTEPHPDTLDDKKAEPEAETAEPEEPAVPKPAPLYGSPMTTPTPKLGRGRKSFGSGEKAEGEAKPAEAKVEKAEEAEEEKPAKKAAKKKATKKTASKKTATKKKAATKKTTSSRKTATKKKTDD